MGVNALSSSSLTFTDSNSSGSTSSSSSISGDNLITKTKSVKSDVWKYFGYKDKAAMKEETTLAISNLPQSCCCSWRKYV